MSATRILRAKVMFNAARDQLASGHMFSSGMAVSLLQDAVEAMAHEVATAVHATTKPQMGFEEHWKVVANVPGKSLPRRSEMLDLNAARVGFKHRGVNPDIADVEKHLAAAHAFLRETSKDCFALDFDELSEADLVRDADIRAAIKRAEAATSATDAQKALEHCRDALDIVEMRIIAAVPMSDGRPLPRLSASDGQRAAELFDWALRKIAALEKGVVLSVLRINPAEYWLLYAALPLKTLGGTYHWRARTISKDPRPTMSLATECIRIVTRLAFRTDQVAVDLQRIAERAGLIGPPLP